MRALINILFLSTILTGYSCKQTGKTTTKKVDRKYFLNHEIPQSIDFEIYLNEKVLTKSIETDHMPGPYELNAKFVPGSAQKIRIKIMPSADSKAKVLKPESIEAINKDLGIYLLENKNYDHIKTIKLLRYPTIYKDTADYNFEWIFFVK